MFNSIGKKIKGLAVSVCLIGIIAFIIVGIVLIANDVDAGWVVLIAGPVSCWIGIFVLYGFGQLVENSDTQIKISQSEQADLHELKSMIENLSNNAKNQMQAITEEGEPTPFSVYTSVLHLADTAANVTQVSPDSNDVEACIYIQLDKDNIRCTKCGTVQRSNRTRCWGCGISFVKNPDSKE